MKKFLTLILALTSFFVFAQKEANMWYFGGNAAVDFNSGFPVALTNSAMNQAEGVSSIADANGNLLFYTNGVQIWNANHQVMSNGSGLAGNMSSTQSALIIQQPGSINLYYLFTTDAQLGLNGFNYSIVDMSLNGGLGDVTIKNTAIYTPSSEKLIGISKANGTDVWIITHEPVNNNFEAYTLSAAGFNNVPVISSVGPSLAAGVNDVIGCMRPSTDGHRLAMALSTSNQFWVFDFDPVTGDVTNPVLITPSGGTGSGAYGVEFSPNGNILYGTVEQASPPNVYQWDLTSGNAAAINASRINLNPTMIGASWMGGLSLAPDGKIYFTRNTCNYLGSINNPDVLGPGCNLSDSALYLMGATCIYGLPNLNQRFYYEGFTYNGPCAGDSTEFHVSGNYNLLAMQWNFGDPSSGASDTSSGYDPSHVFTSPGTYNVTVIKLYPGYSDTIIKPVTVYALPAISLGPDTSFCAGGQFTLLTGGGYDSYLWNDNTTDSLLVVTQPGTYWVEVGQNGCYAEDSIVLSTVTCMPMINLLSSDTVFCGVQCLDFTDLSTNNPTSWQWYFPGADSTSSNAQNPTGICYNTYGSFDVTLIACNAAGCDTLFLPLFITEYQVPPPPVITQGHDTLYSTPAYSYAWYSTANPGNVISTNSYITAVNGGSYFVVISDSVGCQNSSTIFVATGIMETWAGVINVNWDPVSGMVLVNMPGLKSGPAEIKVCNMLGQKIYKTTTSERTTIVDLSTSPGGIYFIQVITPQGTFRKEIILGR